MNRSDSVPRVAFLFLGHIHHVFHTAPIAYELACMGKVEVRLLTSSREGLELLKRVERHYPGNDARIEILEPSLEHRVLRRVKGRPYPRAKFVMRRHEQQLLDYDVLVSPDFYSIQLIQRRRGERPLFVLVFHGAGDREYGPDERLLLYDLVLLPGEKFARRLEALGILPRVSSSIIGYPKFDIFGDHLSVDAQLFETPRPTVLYTPHFVKELSSWHDWGFDILEMFHQSDRYNLILAPHIMLFAKKDPRRLIPSRYFEAPHLHIDTGSLASVDMTYTKLADVYLGDVSSQVYEFVVRPRPCVFLDPHGIDWRGNPSFRFWNLGPVITHLHDLERVFDTPPTLDDATRTVQHELIAETFDLDPAKSSGARAAEAILELLKQ
ncbi:MAG: hypothetical protein ACREK3_09070 [Gemmatimonadota bacterium]